MRASIVYGIVWLIGSALPGIAQTVVHGDYSKLSDVFDKPGKVSVELHPREEISSLDLLIKMSPLIVEGVVTSTLPSVRRNPRLPIALETHSIIAVTRILKGAVPDGRRSIVLAEQGGKFDGWEVVAVNAPLSNLGDRFILFLAPDSRRDPPNSTGLSRYYSVGVWAGKFLVRDSVVEAPEWSEGLHSYSGFDVEVFVENLKEKIQNPGAPLDSLDPDAPLHPTPPPGLGGRF